MKTLFTDIVDCETTDEFPVSGDVNSFYYTRSDRCIFRWVPGKCSYVQVNREFAEEIPDETMKKIAEVFGYSTDNLTTMRRAFGLPDVLDAFVNLRSILGIYVN
jgi:hypothetical protein